ncbi:MAG: hypothetical protein QOH57_5005 [Mycobacterium sp.]|nr:hypothetical protein [Mycobacterium sp.]
MQYFALLLSPADAPDWAPNPAAIEAEMKAYTEFHVREAASIKAGDALTPAAAGARVSGGPDAPVVTDGPFPESAEIAGGFYVFEADDLDAAIALARQIPVAARGAIEIWPMIMEFTPTTRLTDEHWLAVLLEPPTVNTTPGSPEWEAGIARHGDSPLPPVITWSAVPLCTRRAPRRRSGSATTRSCSPTGPTPRAPRWPTASTCCRRPTATKRSSSRR